jgi:MinD superfamily P-loop ATPase
MTEKNFGWYDWQKIDKRIIGCTGGKGGTGKTTVAVNIAYLFSQIGKKVLILDCDVDNPNVSILLGVDLKKVKTVKSFVPKFNDNCTACGKCHEVCQENAILSVPNKKPLIFPEICAGCKACQLVCPEDAIEDNSKIVGDIFEGSNFGIDLITGKLKIGEPLSAEIVKEEKLYALEKIQEKDYDTIIIDTAPGAHCDVLLSLFGSHEVLYVTEPTLYGLFDLRRILQLVQVLDYPIKSYIVLNRSDMTKRQDLIDGVSKEYSVPILGNIPLDRNIELAYAKGVPVIKEYPDSEGSKAYNKIFNDLLDGSE